MGVWGTTPMNTGASQVFIEGDPQRVFGSFLTAQKGTRPAGWDPPHKNTNRRTAMAKTMTVQNG